MSTDPDFKPVHIDDVTAGFTSCADAFAQLAALLAVIRDQSPKHSDAAKLAALGWTVACDMDSYAGFTAEQVQKGGVRK